MTPIPLEQLPAAIEAFLFLYGEAVPFARIAKAFRVTEEAVEHAGRSLAERLAHEAGGLFIIADGNSFQLATKPAFASVLEDLVREEVREDLTPAVAETLAVIAYGGPLTRAEIDYARGVNSSFTLRVLLIRGLIERESSKERGSVYVYRASPAFMRHLGVARVEELPHYEETIRVIRSLGSHGKEADAPPVATDVAERP